MPLKIKERPTKKFNVVKPRRDFSTEQQGMKKTAGSVKPETIQSMAKRARQAGADLGGKSGWKAPSSSEHDSNTRIDDQMHKDYSDNFFQINRGHNRGSVRPEKHFNRPINSSDFFK